MNAARQGWRGSNRIYDRVRATRAAWSSTRAKVPLGQVIEAIEAMPPAFTPTDVARALRRGGYASGAM